MPDVRRNLLEARDRAAASDPGLGRLKQALSATVSVGTTLPVQLLVAHLLGWSGQVAFAATMFGAVVAMLGSNALVAKGRAAAARTAAFFPLALAIGLLPATLTGGHRLLQVVGFAVALFLAVWVRRFGTDFFFFGFMAWMGFFCATFLQATWALVPELLVAAVVSTAWVWLLTSTVFHTDPRRVLHSTLDACFARGRAAHVAAGVAVAGGEAGRPVRDRAARRGLVGRAGGPARGLVGGRAAAQRRDAAPRPRGGARRGPRHPAPPAPRRHPHRARGDGSRAARRGGSGSRVVRLRCAPANSQPHEGQSDRCFRVPVQTQEIQGADHSAAGATFIGLAEAWLAPRFGGVPAPSTCGQS